MDLKPNPHNFSNEDTKKITALGYAISPDSSALAKIINRDFPNFDLVALLEGIERYFTPTTQLSLHRDIQINEQKSTLRICFMNDFADEDEAMVFDREFSKSGNDILVKHSYCVLPAVYQGVGLIKPVFQISLQQYVNMGLRRIIVHAGLKGGGYAWAKHGFVAIDKNEVARILEDARVRLSQDEFNPVEHIFNKYYADFPDGKAFPMFLWAMYEPMRDILRGSDWHGEIDLKISEQFRNFRNYVYRE